LQGASGLFPGIEVTDVGQQKGCLPLATLRI